MITIVNDPSHRVSLFASLVHRLDRIATVRLRLRRRLLAPVRSNEPVANLAAHLDIQHRVAGAMLTIVRDGLSAARAPAQFGARDDGYGAEYVGSRASEGVGHGAAEAEAGGEAQVGVDAEVGLDCLEHLVEEGYVLAVLVGPASVETIGNDEDGRVVGNGFEAVIRQRATTGDVLAVDNFLRTAAARVPGEDEAVGVVLVVVVGDVEDVVAVLPVDLHRVLLVGQCLGFAAARGVCCEDGRHCGQEEAHGREETMHVERSYGEDVLETVTYLSREARCMIFITNKTLAANLFTDAFNAELPSHPRILMSCSDIHSTKTSYCSFRSIKNLLGKETLNCRMKGIPECC
jgi:hypothetical protein